MSDMQYDVLPKDLKLGEMVRFEFNGDPFADAAVIQVTETEVFFFRPYVHLGDFEHTGGVTPYIGAEKWSILRDDTRPCCVLMQEARHLK